MISSASIQKLERYGSLGKKKRSSTNEFIESSLRDEKQTNIFALTHIPTWRDAHASIAGSTAGSMSNKITEPFIAAMAFAVGLIRYDVHHSFLYNNEKSGVFYTSEGTAEGGRTSNGAQREELLRTIKDIVVTSFMRGRHSPNSLGGSEGMNGVFYIESEEFTESFAELINQTTFLFMVIVAAHIRSRDEKLASMGRQTLLLLTILIKNFKTVFEEKKCDKLFTTRNITQQVRNYLNNSKSRPTASAVEHSAGMKRGALNVAGGGSNSKKDSATRVPPFLQLVVELILPCEQQGADGSGSFDTALKKNMLFSVSSFSFFLRMAMLNAVLAEYPYYLASCGDVSGSDAQFLRDACLFLKENMSVYFSNIVNSKTTSYIIYYRNDELKLLQNNIRIHNDNSSNNREVSVYNYISTPPLDQGVMEMITTGSHSNSDSSSNSSASAAAVATRYQEVELQLILSVYVVAVPFYFECFCHSSHWHLFAQEKKRKLLRKEAQNRRESLLNLNTPKRKASKKEAGSGSKSNSSAASVASTRANDDDRNSTSSVRDRSAKDDDTASVFTHSTLQSRLSMQSRYSLLSTLSKRSTASYISFISLLSRGQGGNHSAIGGDRGDNENGDNEDGDPLLVHESDDGNTNLPLILLEESVLNLNSLISILSGTGNNNSSGSSNTSALVDLLWESVGGIFNFIQRSQPGHGGVSLSSTGSSPTSVSIFNFTDDVRYNYGLGFEILGLLFAKVLSPLLEREEENDNKDGGAVAVRNDPNSHVFMDRALALCISSYETLAPHILNSNLQIIIQIISRYISSSTSANNNNNNNNNSGNNVLIQFLCNIFIRCGKNNEINLLLQSLFPDASAGGKDDDDTGAGKGNYAPYYASLINLFRLTQIQNAFIKSSSLSLDPEAPLQSVIGYLTSVTLASKHGDHSSNSSSSVCSHDKMMLLLQIVSLLSRGIIPSSMSSFIILDLSLQIEILLNELFALYYRRGDGAGGKSEGRRREVLFMLMQNLYDNRSLIQSCLQDLGVLNSTTSSMDDYLNLLNGSIFKFDSCPDALVLLPDDDEDNEEKNEEGEEVEARERDSYLTVTQLREVISGGNSVYIIMRLALQRLSLLKSFVTLLSIDVYARDGNKRRLREMLSEVYSFLESESEKEYERFHRSDGGAEVFLLFSVFLNNISEAEWQSFLFFTDKQKRMRKLLVHLVKNTIFTRAQGPASATHGGDGHNLWLNTVLLSLGGILLRALTDVYNSLDISSSGDDSEGKHDQHCSLIRLTIRCFVFAYANGICNPYWSLLLLQSLNFIESSAAKRRRASSSNSGDGNDDDDDLEKQLYALVLVIIQCEESAKDIFRRVMAADFFKQTSKTASGSGKLSEAFIQEIGVPVAMLSDISADKKKNANKENDENEEDGEEGGADSSNVLLDEWTFESEIRAVVKKLFSDEFLGILIDRGAAHGNTDMERANILSILYAVSLNAAKAMHRQYGNFIKDNAASESATSLDSSVPYLFIARTVPHLSAKAGAGGITFLKFFFSSLRNSSVALVSKGKATNKGKGESGGNGVFETTYNEYVRLLYSLLARNLKSSSSTDSSSLDLTEVTILLFELLKESSSGNDSIVEELFSLGDTAGGEGNELRRRVEAYFTPSNHHNSDKSMPLIGLGSKAHEITLLWVLYALLPPEGAKAVNIVELLARPEEEEAKQRHGNAKTAVLSDELTAYYRNVFSALPSMFSLITVFANNNSSGALFDATVRIFQHFLVACEVLNVMGSAVNVNYYLLLSYAVKCLHTILTKVNENGVVVKVNHIRSHIYKLFSLSSQLPVLQTHVHCAAALSSDRSPRDNLIAALIGLMSTSVRALLEDEKFVDTVFQFLLTVLHYNNNNIKYNNFHSGNFLLSLEETRLLIQMLSKSWLQTPYYHATATSKGSKGSSLFLWKRPTLLPPLFSNLFQALLNYLAAKEQQPRPGGVATTTHATQQKKELLHLFSNLCFQFVKESQKYYHSSGGGAAGGIVPFTLAAILSALYQMSTQYVSVFTTFTSETDHLGFDFYYFLKGIYLPRSRMSSITYHPNSVAVAERKEKDTRGNNASPEDSSNTLLDLVFLSLREEGSKSLFKETALRFEEEISAEGNDMYDNNVGGDSANVVKRYLFNADE